MSNDPALNEAVDWLLRLEDSQTSDASRGDFDQWLAASPANQSAWQRVNGILSAPLADLAAVEARAPGQRALASQMLTQSLPRRRILKGGMAAVLLGLAGGTIGNRVTPLTQMFADLHTATGERRNAILSDGSNLTLDARSAADVLFTTEQRRLHLREGALRLDIAKKGEDTVLLESRYGEIYSNDAHILLRQMPDSILLNVLHGQARIAPFLGKSHWVQSGEIIRFDKKTARIALPSLWSRGDWQEGRIELRNEPLGDLIEALRQYHAGWLRISPQASQQRVYGSFLLADLPRTLRALEDSLPVTVHRAGNLLVNIDLKKS